MGRRVVYVDADACPVRAEAERVALRHGALVRHVCNGGIRPSPHPDVEVVFVAEGPDAADRWIAERAGPGDVVVTADVPLADACVAAGARVVTHDGTRLGPQNIGARRAERDLMASLRAADPFHRGGGGGFTKSQRAGFLQALEAELRGG